MEQAIINALSEQYGGAIQMLENIVKNCDEKLWNDNNKEIIISQVVYHTLFFVDYYLSKDESERDRFKEGKLGPDKMGERTDGEKWDKIYSKKELFDYIDDLKVKAKRRFSKLEMKDITNPSLFGWHGSSVLSSFMYNLRHIMLHVGALHVRLNQVNDKPQKWVSLASL